MYCLTHPLYRGRRAPPENCETCKLIYAKEVRREESLRLVLRGIQRTPRQVGERYPSKQEPRVRGSDY